jgi:hypothetical protein
MLCLFVLSLIILDTVIAVDGFVAYRSNTGVSTTSSPKIRYWNNTANAGNGSWSAEIELASAGSPVRFVVLKQSPVDSKIVLVTSSDDGNMDGYICMKNCDNASYWDYTSNIGTVSLVSSQRGFDIAFESNSGDALLVYGIVSANAAQDLAFQELPVSTTSFNGLTEQYINDGGHATDLVYMWIGMDNNPLTTSNEIIIAAFDDTNNDYNAWVWSGSAFGALNAITTGATGTSNREAHAVRYAADGSKGMVVSGTGGAGAINSEYWSAGAWTVVAAIDEDAGDGAADVQWLSLKADPSTDDLQLVFQASTSDLGTAYWNGGPTWAVTSNIDTGVDVATARTADFSWNPTGSTGQLVWDTDGAGTTLSQRTCAPQCTAAGLTVSTYAGTGAWVTLFRNPTTELVKFLGFRLNNAFDIGSFWYNGTGALNYTNYADNVITGDTTVTTFESYFFDYRRDVRPPGLTIITPNQSNILQWQNYIYFNMSSNEYLSIAILDFNGTNYTMNMSTDMNWYYNLTSLNEGLYSYKIYGIDLANNTNVTPTWNITINFPPNITLINPPNNTLNITTGNITFYYNVTDTLNNVSTCSLIIDGLFGVVNTTTSPVNETTTLNFTYLLTNGQHNWSIWCNDTNNFNSTSEMRNITIALDPIILSMDITDNLLPSGEVILNAGSTRFVNCTIIASDPQGTGNIANATAMFYYYLNKSNDPDDNWVHYTNTSCVVANITLQNKTFSCGFYPWYYANNGTWYCNATITNNDSLSASNNTSTIIQSLYALNVTDGIDFGNVESEVSSLNVTANITNIGNMAVNITIQGYALAIGDNTGMNCSDNTNITITRIKFSKITTDDYTTKTSLTGSVQNLNLQIPRQTNLTQMINTTYWQVNPDPGISTRICTGYVIFTAEVP